MDRKSVIVAVVQAIPLSAVPMVGIVRGGHGIMYVVFGAVNLLKI